ncbi:GAF domain-containing protein [Citricoccus nitrophenolicus]|uniref:GAF domain-containing protein n=1 Tax=Citricoccus nitrophenolicus TaxID=863575 RepID=A0ABV0IJ75_9MICC
MTLPLSGPAYQQAVERAHGELAALTRFPGRGLGQLRGEVADSWRRSLVNLGGPAGRREPRMVSDDDLRDVRQGHRLSPVLPIIRRLLVDPALDAGLIVALGNAEGQLLWVEGDPVARRRAETMGFVPGADWSEASMGTSAPGVALYSGRPVQVSRAEHFHPVVHPWSCSAVPLRDPADGRIVGVIDLTGGDEAVSPLALPLLSAAAEAVQSAWRDHALPAPVGPPLAMPSPPGPDAGREVLVRVTGGLPPRVSGPHGTWCEASGKHAEILTLLDWHGPGLGGAELEDLLYGHHAGTTLRAEMHRLRRFLAVSVPSLSIRSRPYRLDGGLVTDAVLARDALRRGEVGAALSQAAGPVLPRSVSPGITEIRRQLEADLRESVLENAGIEDLWSYAGRPEAAGDLDVWMTALQLLPADSPRRSLAVSAVERLQAEGA